MGTVITTNSFRFPWRLPLLHVMVTLSWLYLTLLLPTTLMWLPKHYNLDFPICSTSQKSSCTVWGLALKVCKIPSCCCGCVCIPVSKAITFDFYILLLMNIHVSYHEHSWMCLMGHTWLHFCQIYASRFESWKIYLFSLLDTVKGFPKVI